MTKNDQIYSEVAPLLGAALMGLDQQGEFVEKIAKDADRDKEIEILLCEAIFGEKPGEIEDDAEQITRMDWEADLDVLVAQALSTKILR